MRVRTTKHDKSKTGFLAPLFLVVLSFSAGFLSCKDSEKGCTDVKPPPNESPKPMDELADWSPDGQWIVYTHLSIDPGDTTYSTGLYLIDTTGGNRRLMLTGYASAPRWSPDDSTIAFAAVGIFKIRVSGGLPVVVFSADEAFFPCWSPDGTKLAFDTPYQDPRGANVIWTINSDGTGLNDISQHGVGEWREPDWSPDGTRILHERYVGIGTEEVFVMDTAGSGATRLTNNSDEDRHARWSGDGLKIAWTRVVGSDAKIFLMNSDGTSQQQLVDGLYPSWSPDSREIVFSRLSPDRGRIVLWKIRVDGSGLRQLTF